ncbi:MAG: DNA double-strand break repair nuclease NurA [Candidatus Micrarchaeota archaeon]
MYWSSASITRIVANMNELKQRCAINCTEVQKAYADKKKPIIYDIAPVSFDGVVAAVDSGFSTKQFVSLDVMLLRSTAAVFTYKQNALVANEYFPSRVPGVSVHCGVFSEPSDSLCFRSLLRLSAELNCALQTVKMYSPQMLLIDGSLLPLPNDKPSKESSLHEMYAEVLQAYNNLFATCSEMNCALVGVVKDSRSQRLCNLIEQELKQTLPVNSDEFVTDLLLSRNQRSLAFQINEENAANVKLSDKINAFYMKAGDALPYRVEFIGGEEKADEIAANLCALGSSQFAYPSILIEVDMRAALTPGEITSVFNSLESVNRDLVLRSNSRPFR